MMRTIKIYVPPGQPGPLLEFLPTLDEKLRRKLLQQIVRLSQIHLCDLKEPHFKHFVLEKYNQLYELREKNKVLARIIFTIRDGDIIVNGIGAFIAYIAPFFSGLATLTP